MQNHDNWSTINFCFKIIVSCNGTSNVGNENDEHDGTLAIIFINIFLVQVFFFFFFNERWKNNFRGLFTLYDLRRSIEILWIRTWHFFLYVNKKKTKIFSWSRSKMIICYFVLWNVYRCCRFNWIDYWDSAAIIKCLCIHF